MVWTLDDILGDEYDTEFSNPSNPHFQLANYLRQPVVVAPMAPTTTSPELPVATEAAKLEATTPTPTEVTTEVPDDEVPELPDEDFTKALSDGIDEAHLNDAAEAADKAEREGRDFAALPLEPLGQASEGIESARGEVRSSRRREPIMEDDSDEEPDRRRKIPTSTSGPEPFDLSILRVSSITEDMPQEEIDQRNKQNLKISEMKMNAQHEANKAEAELEQRKAKARARRAQIVGEKGDDRADGEAEAARARARSSRRYDLAMEDEEQAEAACRHQITESIMQEGDATAESDDSENDDQVCVDGDAEEKESEEENEDKDTVNEDKAASSGDESESIIPKQPQAASSYYTVSTRSGNFRLKFKIPQNITENVQENIPHEIAQQPSIGKLQSTPGIPESYPGFHMKLNTDVLPPEEGSEEEEEGEDEEKEEDDDDNAVHSEEEESEDDMDLGFHGSLTKILGNSPVPAYLSSKAKVPRFRRGITRPFSGVPTLPAPQSTPLSKNPFVPQPQPITPPAPFMGFGSYRRNTTTTAPSPSVNFYDPMNKGSHFTPVTPASFTPMTWKPIIPTPKTSTNATSFTPIPWTPVIPIQNTSTSATPSAHVPYTRPGLMTSPPIPEPEFQAYEYVHESRTDSNSESSAASEATDGAEDETFAFSDDEREPNDNDDDLLAGMTGENSEPITEEDREAMEETFTRMTGGDELSSIDYQMTSFERSFDYDPLDLPVDTWTGSNPADEYNTNQEMISASSLLVQEESSDHDMLDSTNFDNDTDFVGPNWNNNAPEHDDEDEAMVDNQPVEHRCAMPEVDSAEMRIIGRTEMIRLKFNAENAIEYIHGVIVHPRAPTLPQPDPNVTSSSNDIEMGWIVETDSNIEGEVHQQASASTNENMSESFNINIGMVSIVETDSNIDGSVHSEQPGESITTESDMSNVRFSNISSRSVVELDWDIDEPDTPRRNGPIALMGEEAILQYISAGPESGVSDQHVTELALQLEKWSVTESVDLVAVATTITPTPTPEVGPTTGINPTSPQHPAASNLSPDSSSQLSQDAASISEQERDTNSSQSSVEPDLTQTKATESTLEPTQDTASPQSTVEPDLVQTKNTASSSVQGQETSSSESNVESDLVKSLKEQLRKANQRADTAEANLAAEKKAREADKQPASRRKLNMALDLLNNIRQGFVNAIHHTGMEKEFEAGNEAPVVDEYIPLSANLIRRLRRQVEYYRAQNAALKRSQEQSTNKPVGEPVTKPTGKLDEKLFEQLVEELLQVALKWQPTKQLSKKPAEKSVKQPLRPAIEQRSAKKSADEPVQQPIRLTTEQLPARTNSVLAIPADPEGVDPVPVSTGSVDPPTVDPGITSRLNQILGAPCKVNFKTVLRLEKDRLERAEAVQRVNYRSRDQRLQENVELPNSNITSANVPLPNSNNISANVVLPTNNNHGSAARWAPTLRGVAATLCISFLVPMAVSFIL